MDENYKPTLVSCHAFASKFNNTCFDLEETVDLDDVRSEEMRCDVTWGCP